MLLLLSTLAGAQEIGSKGLHIGVQLTTNDPFVHTTTGVAWLSLPLSSWLGLELGGAGAPAPPRSTWTHLSDTLMEDTIGADLAYLRALAWAGLQITPVRYEYRSIYSRTGVHLGLGAVHSMEPWWESNVGESHELSPMNHYGLHSSLSIGRWGLDLRLSGTRHRETFERLYSAPDKPLRKNAWVYGGLSCHL